MFTPTHHPTISAAGRHTRHCLYAVFDAEVDAQQAERALAAGGIAVRRPDWTQRAWNRSLRTVDARGFWETLHGVLHDLRAEVCELERYAEHSAHGRVVLVACGVDPSLAQQAVLLLARYGADDITYLGTWAVTYVSPGERHVSPAEPEHPTSCADLPLASAPMGQAGALPA